ncbi:PIG-P protein, partial [Nadsonia fulvescens var. elongata DSM 6958]
EYRGFILHTVSSLEFVLYILWSSLPASTLESIHIYYYPSRWWSLAIPAWLVMALIFIYISLALYNTEYATKPLQSLTCLSDEFSILAIEEPLRQLQGPSFLFSPSDGVWDLPINDVCNVLYGDTETED